MQQLETPVLLLIFNRPETTFQVFAKIRKARPKKLYIAADGPRSEIPGESKICDSIRTQVLDAIDWECAVYTLFRELNLGCKIAVSSAISWFFENEEQGIILEDDCVPDPSFFQYCATMLKAYRSDNRVMMISGTNYLMGENITGRDYFFSRYFSIWGWATWRRAWIAYDIEMEKWPELSRNGRLKYLVALSEIECFYRQMLEPAYQKAIDTWDLQWVYTCLVNNGLAVVPVNNLVKNIGIDGTHTDGKVNKFIGMETKPFPISEFRGEKYVVPDFDCDAKCFSNIGVTITSSSQDVPRSGILRRITKKIIRRPAS